MPPDEWKDPYAHIVAGHRTMEFLGPLLLVSAVKERKLSQRILALILHLLETRSNQEFHSTVDTGENSDHQEESLLWYCIKLAEQSYELACDEFDEPQLACLATYALCLISQRFSVATSSLVRLSSLNEVAAARVLRYSIAARLPFDGNIAIVLPQLLDDFRTFVRRKHDGPVELLVLLLPNLWPVVSHVASSSPQQTFELIYLLAEFYLKRGEYLRVIKLPETFHEMWELYENDKKALATEVRRVNLCIARAKEAIGELSDARDLYLSCGIDPEDLRKLDACLHGTQIYVAAVDIAETIGTEIEELEARELGDGSIALLSRRKENLSQSIQFHLFDPHTGSLSIQQLPYNGKQWRAVKVIPDTPSSPLMILVAPRHIENTDNRGYISEIIERMEVLGSPTVNEPIELWRYENLQWKEIKTRGTIPSRLNVIRIGSHCVLLEGKLIVFGGTSLLGTSAESSCGVFLLDLLTREWFRLPHPYQQSLFIDSQGRPSSEPSLINTSLPPILNVFKIKNNGQNLLALLRQKKEVNPRRNELVPKYALDLVIFEQITFRPECFWLLDVQTTDRCGYMGSLMHTKSIQIGHVALVVGKRIGWVEQQQLDGSVRLDGNFNIDKQLTITALDVEQMEWRGLDMYKKDLITTEKNPLLVPSSSKSACHLIMWSSKELQVFRLENLQSLSLCFTKPISKQKLQSKKFTVSYQIKKAQKKRMKAVRECAFCHVFEALSGSTHDFKCCARCRVPFYCSKKCQKQHWRAGHKTECTSILKMENL